MKNQITKVLSRKVWDSVRIQENNEPLVSIENDPKIFFAQFKEYTASYIVRKTIAQKLIAVAKSLPENIQLVLIEGYRSTVSQQDGWDKTMSKLKLAYLNMSQENLEQKARMVVAKPTPLANHHCGGAIDVTLRYSDGEYLDMGTSYPDVLTSMDQYKNAYKKFPMFPNSFFQKRITKEQELNRKILRDAMETEDFVWYPGEWWHYCWGDRMWAVYTNQTECVYGSIELQ